ncbi:MAG: ACT domain-containing protein [Spirochaetia bacterium]|jgi:acetolactate synthase-1/3 small subunit
MNSLPNTIVKLMVKNHPGAMSHITGLFSRRGFNLEGILCAPVDGGAESAMYLLVRNDERLEQIVKQLRKLYDVKSVSVQDDLDHTVFNRIEELLSDAQLPREEEPV